MWSLAPNQILMIVDLGKVFKHLCLPNSYERFVILLILLTREVFKPDPTEDWRKCRSKQKSRASWEWLGAGRQAMRSGLMPMLALVSSALPTLN